MAMHLQGSLFDQSDDLHLGPLTGLRRRELGAGAWAALSARYAAKSGEPFVTAGPATEHLPRTPSFRAEV